MSSPDNHSRLRQSAEVFLAGTLAFGAVRGTASAQDHEQPPPIVTSGKMPTRNAGILIPGFFVDFDNSAGTKLSTNSGLQDHYSSPDLSRYVRSSTETRAEAQSEARPEHPLDEREIESFKNEMANLVKTNNDPEFFTELFERMENDQDHYFRVFRDPNGGGIWYLYYPDGAEDDDSWRVKQAISEKTYRNADNIEIYEGRSRIVMDLGIDGTLTDELSESDIFSPDALKILLQRYFSLPQGLSELPLIKAEVNFLVSGNRLIVTGLTWKDSIYIESEESYGVDSEFNFSVGSTVSGLMFLDISSRVPAEIFQAAQARQAQIPNIAPNNLSVYPNERNLA